jgi:FkbM family methyltransferase
MAPMSVLRRQRGIEQRNVVAKRLFLGPVAPPAMAWALSGTPSARKAAVMRRLVFPPTAAAAKDYERLVPPGLRYAGNTKDLLGLMVYLFDVWEPNLSAFLQRRLNPGDTFIDVGANSGWFTAMGAHLVGPTGKVVGIEASPTIAARVQANLDRNGFAQARVVNAAATSRPCWVDVVPGPDENLGITRIEKTHSADAIQVRGDALPSLLSDEEIRTARVVKIDVEGAEYDVIAGLDGSLDRFPDTCEFVVEVGAHRTEQEAVDRLFESFTSVGYTPYNLPNLYSVRSYMLDAIPESLDQVTGRPEGQVDVVFSRLGGRTLAL